MKNGLPEPRQEVVILDDSLLDTVAQIGSDRLPIGKNRAIEGLVAGSRFTKRIGDGWEFNGIRPYLPGDDPRSIDWRSSARIPSGELVIRTKYKDTEPTVWFATDVVNGRYNVNPGEFTEQSLALSALLHIHAIARKMKMPTGLVVGNGNSIYASSRAKNGSAVVRDHVDLLLQSAQYPSKGVEKPSVALSDVLKEAAKRSVGGVVVVASDFRDDVPRENEASWREPLLEIASRNQLIAIETTNSWDYELPKHISAYGTGTGKWRLPTGRRGQKFRESYATEAQAQQDYIDKVLAHANAAHIKLSADNPLWLDSLREQMAYYARIAEKA